MHYTAMIPKIAIREMPTRWEKRGSPDINTRALEEVTKIYLTTKDSKFTKKK